MNRILSYIISVILLFSISSCSFLEPLPNGTYTDENKTEYPLLIMGLIYKAYSLVPYTYYSSEFIGLDCCTDDIIYTSPSASMRQFSIGNAQPNSYSLDAIWERDYLAINYVNRFLYNNTGLNTKYLLDETDNAKLQKYLQGDAFGLRAWFLFDLIKKFGGKDADGTLLGVPIFTEPNELADSNPEIITRPLFDDCIRQILDDCDQALKYLPEANRDFVVAPSASMIDGAARYRSLDKVSIRALKSLVYLYWASPMFNPQNDITRWEKSAEYAALVMKYKLEIEGVQRGGFNPTSACQFTYANDPEIIWPSTWKGNAYESKFYPIGFNGTAVVAPTQELVDAFPASNGYPIDDSRSSYDSSQPYENRDPRFYATINCHGSEVRRGGSSGAVMYTFDVSDTGVDAPGLISTSSTGYYVKKYVYNKWNKYDKEVQSASTCIFFLRWTQMCLAFAEASNHVVGPTNTSRFGYSARQALSFLRSRSTIDGISGLGVVNDPYLDECATSGEAMFDKLVKNEWRIETCFEGWRFMNLRRWGTSLADLNVSVHGVRISADGAITHPVVETKKFPSQWLPLPYLEVRKCRYLHQNEGWEDWK